MKYGEVMGTGYFVSSNVFEVNGKPVPLHNEEYRFYPNKETYIVSTKNSQVYLASGTDHARKLIAKPGEKAKVEISFHGKNAWGGKPVRGSTEYAKTFVT